LSIGVSLLLLTFMMTVWRVLYRQGERGIRPPTGVRHRVSLTNFSLPGFYREKIRGVPGVVAVVPNSWFGGLYKDDTSRKTSSPSSAPIPTSFRKSSRRCRSPPDQLRRLAARPCQGVIVNDELAQEIWLEVGDRIVLQGTIYPVNLELTVRGIFHWPTTNKTVYFNAKYVEEAVSWFKGQAGTFSIHVWRRRDVPGSPVPWTICFATRRSQPRPRAKRLWPELREHAGQCEGFHSEHLLAVVFTTLLVSANTMAMSIRERTREVAVLKTLGLSGRPFLALFVGEAVSLWPLRGD
jgi:putative ABC transport system permease protein